MKWDKTPEQMETRLNGILHRSLPPMMSRPATRPCARVASRSRAKPLRARRADQPQRLEILPEIVKIGVRAIKVEGRQRSPAYVTQVTCTLCAALDAFANESERLPSSRLAGRTVQGPEGNQATLGAYNRPWR